MFDPVSAADIVRVICSAYLLSICFLLSFTTCGWWVLAYLDNQDRQFPRGFS